MLLLVTLALVVASAVLLILGFVQDTLGFIYLSMLCAGVAALALFVFARLARRRSAVMAGAGVIEGAAPADERPARSRRRTASPVPAAGQEEEEGARSEAAQEAERETVGAVTVRSAGDPVIRSFESRPPRPEMGEPEMDEEEVEPVADRPDNIAVFRPEADTAIQPVVAARPEEQEAWPDEDWSDWGDEIVFPIEDYDELRVSEILPLLGQLEPDELQEVRDRELAGKARATILDRIDDRLGRSAPAQPVAEAEEEPVPAPIPFERPAGRAASTRKAAPARKATTPRPARKAAAPAGAAEPAAPAKRTPRRAPTEAAPAPAAKKTAAKKTAAKKAATTRTTATTAKASTAAKAPTASKTAATKASTASKTAAKKATVKQAAPTRAAATKRVAAEAPDAPAPAKKATARRTAARKQP